MAVLGADGRYAVSASVLRSGALETDLDWARQAQASAIGLLVEPVEAAGALSTRHLLDTRGLAASALGGLWRTLDPVDDMQVARMREVIETASAVRAPVVMVITGDRESLSRAEADRRTRAWFAEAGPIAHDFGVRLALEPVHPLLSWATYVHTLRHAADLVAGVPGGALLFDLGHVWPEPSVFDNLVECIELIGLVQIDDVDGAALAQGRYQRTTLGDGTVPAAELVLALEAAGYSGFYENEIVHNLPSDARVPFVRAGRQWLDSVLSRSAAELS